MTMENISLDEAEKIVEKMVKEHIAENKYNDSSAQMASNCGFLQGTLICLLAGVTDMNKIINKYKE